MCGLWRLAWHAEGDVAATLLWDDQQQRGVLWTNDAHVPLRLYPLISRWARHRAWTGHQVDVLLAEDLQALDLTLLTPAS